MSKDKGSKNVKKAPAENQTKKTSDYQAGKKFNSADLAPTPKKK